MTLLLMGSDRGPGNWGERTDTMIVAALAARHRARGGVRRAAQPRRRPARRRAGRVAEAVRASRSTPSTRSDGPGRNFPGRAGPRRHAVKQTLSRLLGIRIDYFALVDLVGFADLVDALGGVDIRVKERLVD